MQRLRGDNVVFEAGEEEDHYESFTIEEGVSSSSTIRR